LNDDAAEIEKSVIFRRLRKERSRKIYVFSQKGKRVLQIKPAAQHMLLLLPQA
jgi:hypothetical protein